jgi:outer membrane immunogenic protein
MRKFLFAGVFATAFAGGSALAADLPRRAPEPVYKAVEPMFNWSGFYVGTHVGYGWGDADLDHATGGALAHAKPAGWFGGGQAGYNWQFSPNWVWGVETDLSGSGLKDSNPFTNVAGVTFRDKIDYFGTARARLGYTVDRVMIYGTAGLAWAHNKAIAIAGAASFPDDHTHLGWTAGLGIEYAFAPNWSAKLEWLFADYGSKTYSSGGNTARIDLTDNTVKIGLNYRFGDWGKGPVSSRY